MGKKMLADMSMGQGMRAAKHMLFTDASSIEGIHPNLLQYPSLLGWVKVATPGALQVLSRVKPKLLREWEGHLRFDGPLDFAAIRRETDLVIEQYAADPKGGITLRKQGNPEAKILAVAVAKGTVIAAIARQV